MVFKTRRDLYHTIHQRNIKGIRNRRPENSLANFEHLEMIATSDRRRAWRIFSDDPTNLGWNKLDFACIHTVVDWKFSRLEAGLCATRTGDQGCKDSGQAWSDH